MKTTLQYDLLYERKNNYYYAIDTEGKVSPYSSSTGGTELIPVYTRQLSGRLPILSASPAVTFPAEERHYPLTSTKLYCLVTEAHRCKELGQGFYTALPGGNRTHDLMIASPTLYRHATTPPVRYRYI